MRTRAERQVWWPAQTSPAGLQNGLVGLGQDLVADLGVGDGPVFLAQVKTQLALVAEVKVALLTLNETGGGQVRGAAARWTRQQGLCVVTSGTHSVGLLSGVDAQVALQGLQVAEAGATGVAGVRLLPCMDQDVGPQMSDLTAGKKRFILSPEHVSIKKCVNDITYFSLC